MKTQPPTSSKNILVTGGAGYIGSHTCKWILRNGFTPISVDNLVNGNKWAVQFGPFEQGSIGDSAFMEKTLKKYKPIAVMHFAALAYVGESMDLPLQYYANNVAETIALLHSIKSCVITNLIFSSTCATFGVPVDGIIRENSPQTPINPYGRSKLMIEQILHDCRTAYGLDYAILRYFNAGGADPKGEIGELHTPETHLIPIAIQTALGTRSHLSIYGTDLATPDGSPVRDYIHVCDLAQAHIQVLKRLLAQGGSHAYNLGTSRGYSVKEVVKAVEAISGSKVPTIASPPRRGDPPILRAERLHHSEEELEWEPTMSSLENIVTTAFNWHKNTRTI